MRLRHTYAGDLGPYTLPDTTTVQQLKDKVFAEWPKGGWEGGLRAAMAGGRGAGRRSTTPPDGMHARPACPADGSWSKEPPSQAADIRLILSGKFLDNAQALKGEWVVEGSGLGSPCSPIACPPPPACRLPSCMLFACPLIACVFAARADYRKDMGEIKADTVVTMHLHIRPQQTASKQPSECATVGRMAPPGSHGWCRCQGVGAIFLHADGAHAPLAPRPWCRCSSGQAAGAEGLRVHHILIGPEGPSSSGARLLARPASAHACDGAGSLNIGPHEHSLCNNGCAAASRRCAVPSPGEHSSQTCVFIRVQLLSRAIRRSSIAVRR